MSVRFRQTLVGAVVATVLVVPTLVAAAQKPDLAKGKKLVTDAGCLGCHKIGATGGPTGPDMTHAGKTWKAADIRKKIENPKYNMPNSLMPSAATLSLSKKDVTDLTGYLASLK